MHDFGHAAVDRTSRGQFGELLRVVEIGLDPQPHQADHGHRRYQQQHEEFGAQAPVPKAPATGHRRQPLPCIRRDALAGTLLTTGHLLSFSTAVGSRSDGVPAAAVLADLPEPTEE
jgi:hypothetical protein